MTPDSTRTWSPEDVSQFLGIPVPTLYRWRCQGTGPKAARVGRHLRYLPEDVIAWLRQRQDTP